MISVEVLDNSYFQTKNSSIRLPEEFTMHKKIGSQMSANVFTKTLAGASQPFKSSTDFSVVTNVVVSLVYGGSMYYIFSMINTLQMNLHLPMIEGIDFP